MNLSRILGAAVVCLTGVGLAAVSVHQFLTGGLGAPGLLIAGATLLIGVSFAVAGPVLYRSDIESNHLLRIAGWNTLGVVVTVAVLLLVGAFQAASGGDVTAPLLSGAVVVGVSAFAHVLIGFNDVRRIRARTVARQRRKAAVMNRFLRHDLRHAAQLLLGYGDQLDATHDGDIGGKVANIGYDLVDSGERLDVLDDLIEGVPHRQAIDVRATIEEERDEWASDHPEATLTVDIEDDPTVYAGEHFPTAITELVENACNHGGDAPTVTVEAAPADDGVSVRVLDDGDGIPEQERDLINEGRMETDLEHSSGMGLWLVRWIAEFYDGTFRVETRPEGGSEATLTLPAA